MSIQSRSQIIPPAIFSKHKAAGLALLTFLSLAVLISPTSARANDELGFIFSLATAYLLEDSRHGRVSEQRSRRHAAPERSYRERSHRERNNRERNYRERNDNERNHRNRGFTARRDIAQADRGRGRGAGRAADRAGGRSAAFGSRNSFTSEPLRGGSSRRTRIIENPFPGRRVTGITLTGIDNDVVHVEDVVAYPHRQLISRRAYSLSAYHPQRHINTRGYIDYVSLKAKRKEYFTVTFHYD